MGKVVEIFLRGIRGWPVTLHHQCHACWWPGEARSQSSSSNGTDIPVMLPEYSSLNISRYTFSSLVQIFAWVEFKLIFSFSVVHIATVVNFHRKIHSMVKTIGMALCSTKMGNKPSTRYRNCSSIGSYLVSHKGAGSLPVRATILDVVISVFGCHGGWGTCSLVWHQI